MFITNSSLLAKYSSTPLIRKNSATNHRGPVSNQQGPADLTLTSGAAPGLGRSTECPQGDMVVSRPSASAPVSVLPSIGRRAAPGSGCHPGHPCAAGCCRTGRPGAGYRRQRRLLRHCWRVASDPRDALFVTTVSSCPGWNCRRPSTQWRTSI